MITPLDFMIAMFQTNQYCLFCFDHKYIYPKTKIWKNKHDIKRFWSIPTEIKPLSMVMCV